MTAFSREVSADGNDGYVNDAGGFATTDGVMYVGDDGFLAGNTNWAWMLFDNIVIPKDATINSASIDVWENASTLTPGTLNIDIRIEDVDEGTVPTSAANEALKSWYSTVVDWAPEDFDGDGTKYTTPDISALIQYIVNRSGWSSGNDILLEFYTTENTSDRWFDDYGGLGGKPILNVVYTEGGAVAQPALSIGTPF